MFFLNTFAEIVNLIIDEKNFICLRDGVGFVFLLT